MQQTIHQEYMIWHYNNSTRLLIALKNILTESVL